MQNNYSYYTLLVLVLVLSLNMSVFSQDTSFVAKKITMITTVKAEKNTRAYLAGITDSSVILSDARIRYSELPSKTSLNTMKFDEIKEVRFKRKGSVGRGVLIGGISGFISGALAGLIIGDDKVLPPSEDPFRVSAILYTSAGEKALGLGVTGMMLGSITGALIGALSTKRFVIGNDRSKFHAMSAKMKSRLMQPVSL